MNRLSGKVIIVAGGGGIGNILAKRYAEEGAKVVLGDYTLSVAEQAVQELSLDGEGEILPTRIDGRDEASIEAIVALARDEFGGLDGFHANFASFADGLIDAAVLDLPLEIFDEVMQVNARGFFLCTRAALPELLRRGGGSILYTSSGAAHSPSPTRAAYAMSKAAVHALARVVATRHGPDNIRANVIAPGVIMHETLAANTDESFKAWARSKSAIRTRFGRSEDIAAMGALLMSDEGSFITGQVISVDGGGSMRP